MTLRARIWILLLVAVLLVLAAAVALRSGYSTVARTSNAVATRLQPASDSIADLNTALAEMDSRVTAYALTADVADLRPTWRGPPAPPPSSRTCGSC